MVYVVAMHRTEQKHRPPRQALYTKQLQDVCLSDRCSSASALLASKACVLRGGRGADPMKTLVSAGCVCSTMSY